MWVISGIWVHCATEGAILIVLFCIFSLDVKCSWNCMLSLEIWVLPKHYYYCYFICIAIMLFHWAWLLWRVWVTRSMNSNGNECKISEYCAQQKPQSKMIMKCLQIEPGSTQDLYSFTTQYIYTHKICCHSYTLTIDQLNTFPDSHLFNQAYWLRFILHNLFGKIYMTSLILLWNLLPLCWQT